MTGRFSRANALHESSVTVLRRKKTTGAGKRRSSISENCGSYASDFGVGDHGQISRTAQEFIPHRSKRDAMPLVSGIIPDHQLRSRISIANRIRSAVRETPSFSFMMVQEFAMVL